MAKMKEIMTRAAEKLGIAGLAQKARTATDYDDVLAEISAQLDAARQEFADLEAKRPTLLLEGGDMDEYHRALNEVQQRLATLAATQTETQRRRDEAATTEAKVNLEAEAERVRKEHLEGYERDLNEEYLAMVAVIRNGEKLEAHDRAVKDFNFQAQAAGRPDLIMNLSSLRMRLAESLFEGSALLPKPERLGQVDPDLARRLRAFRDTRDDQKAKAKLMAKHGVSQQMLDATETDAAFQLRMANWQARARDAIVRDDPLRVAGDRAVEMIERTVFYQDAHHASRNRRRVEVRQHVDVNGGVYDNIRPLDGRGQMPLTRRLNAIGQDLDSRPAREQSLMEIRKQAEG